jgi:cytoskeletal protein RodZ
MENNQAAAPLTLETLGEMLKAQRLAVCLSVEDTARKLLLSPSQLEGLEQGDLNSFYSAYYYQKALTKYLQLLQLEVDLSSLQLPIPTAIPVTVHPTGNHSAKRTALPYAKSFPTKVLAASTLLLAVISGAGFLVWQNQNAALKAFSPSPAVETQPQAALPVVPADGNAASANGVTAPAAEQTGVTPGLAPEKLPSRNQ